MANEFRWSKELTMELILNYEALPILYNPRHADYKDRVKKIDALESVLVALKPLNPMITVDAIKRKVHTLRSQFIKEFRDIENSKKSGAGTDDVHEPKLWCYEHLGFLKTFCQIRSSDSNVGEKRQNEPSSPAQDTSSQDDLDPEFTPKRKRSAITASAVQSIEKATARLYEKVQNKSPYAWLGKQVVFQIDLIKNESIRQQAIIEIQQVLNQRVQDDLALQRITPQESDESVPSTSKAVRILSNAQIRPPSSQSVATTGSPFTPDLLEQSMEGVFDEDDFT